MTANSVVTSDFSSQEKRKLLAEILERKARRSSSPGITAGPETEERRGQPELEDSLVLHRMKFPALANKAYFNYGAQGPMPRSALAAIYEAFEYVQSLGPFSVETSNWMMQEAAKTRASLAAELSVPTSTITLTENTSAGCNIVLWGIDWQPGDHVLLSNAENTGIVAAVREVQKRFNLEVSICPLLESSSRGNTVALIAEHFKPRTRLLVLSHVFWNTGQLLPLAEIMALCRYRSNSAVPALVLVDAAQSVGVMPLNLTELDVDFYAFTGQKWWCGPEGVGGLYVKPETGQHLRSTFTGWRSLDDATSTERGQRDGKRFEVGSSAFPLYAGLRNALAVHNAWGSQKERYQRIRHTSRYLWQRLRDLSTTALEIKCLKDSAPETGIVSFQLAGRSCQDLVYALESQNLLVRTMHDPSCVRVCVHYLTTEDEVDRLVEAIEEYCRAQLESTRRFFKDTGLARTNPMAQSVR